MRTVIQVVSQAEVKINHKSVGAIKTGLMVLAAFKTTDTADIINQMAKKICQLRIFPDEFGKLNQDVKQVSGEILVVPQFTLYGRTKGTNRPDFCDSAPAAVAEPLYNSLVAALRSYAVPVSTGQFREMMSVSLINEGPTTIIIDL
jgi:D-tyrosyl-tRNA(Tyr) deacylase